MSLSSLFLFQETGATSGLNGALTFWARDASEVALRPSVRIRSKRARWRRRAHIARSRPEERGGSECSGRRKCLLCGRQGCQVSLVSIHSSCVYPSVSVHSTFRFIPTPTLNFEVHQLFQAFHKLCYPCKFYAYMPLNLLMFLSKSTCNLRIPTSCNPRPGIPSRGGGRRHKATASPLLPSVLSD